MDPASSAPYDPRLEGERRAPEPLLYTPEQLLGRGPIRLRRRSDRRRLAAHVVVAIGLVSLAGWWTLIPHSFAGPVLLSLTPDHGMHVGDLPALGFAAVAGRSLLAAHRVVIRPTAATPVR